MDPSTRFLLQGVARAAVVANAHKPVARHGPVAIPGFFGGWLVSEAPFLTLATQAVGTAQAARRGGLRGWRGKAGLALTGAAAAGLWNLHRQAREAEGIFVQALHEQLGGDFREEIHEDLALLPDEPLTRRQVTLPRAGLRKQWVHASNVAYGEHGRRNHLDIWRRADLPSDGAAPVLLQVHGGAWVIGNKDQQAQPLLARMAERGWVCVSINYRLSPRSAWPDHITDVKRAIAWVREHIAEYGGDPRYLAITGGSAGGHLSSLAALTPNDPAYQVGFEEADTTLQAAVPVYGVYDFTNSDGTGLSEMGPFLERSVMKSPLHDTREIWEAASPLLRVGPDAPPFFVTHGTNDTLVPVEQARSFVAKLRSLSKEPVVYAELPGAQHAFEVFDSVRSAYFVRAVDAFLSLQRSRWLAGLAQP